MSQLQQIQQLFIQAIFDDNSASSAINELAVYLVHNNQLSSDKQISIYRDSVFGSLSTALAQIYPVCRKLVGEEFFDFMATQYIKKYYSTSPDLAEYGNQLALFIADFKPAAELVYLADVARLEWAWHKAFHGPDQDGLNINDLAKALQQQSQSLSLELALGASLISSIYPVDAIWLANQDENEHDEVINLDQGGVKLLLWRKQYDMHIDTLNDNEWLFLNAIAEIQSFMGICDHFEAHPEVDVATLLPKCIQNGWIAEFKLGVNQ